MKSKYIIFSLSSFVSFLVSCTPPSSPQNENPTKSGVVITFDDLYLNDWVVADSIFSQQNWKATFCIPRFPELSNDYKNKIIRLQNNGNEIAFHGTHHVNAVHYLRKHSANEYLNYEIIPGLTEMKNFGLNVTSFAYPEGVRSVVTDKILFNYFTVLRGITFLSLPPEEQKSFRIIGEKHKLVYAIGVDSHYKHMRISYIDSLLQFAFDEGKILLFYGHHISENDSPQYVTAINTLNYICNFVNKNKMKFYTLSEVAEK